MRITWISSVLLAGLVSLSILFLDPLLRQIQLLPDQGASWYYWKLPDPTFFTRATAWGFYLAHQFFFWGIIWWAQRNREKLKNRNRMHAVNWIALGGAAVFAGLHYIQTAIWYDGLAQDVSVFSSQASVVLLLVIVLLMEAPRRGLFFGYGGRGFVPIRTTLIKYHGYYFAWAITFTYWFHPMETTPGHLLGFFYTFLLMIQGAFLFTRVHTNRWWTVTLEALVLVHGVTVAVIAGQEIWPMFLFGFAGIFIVTQLHGLGLSRLTRGVVMAAFLTGMFYVYGDRGWEKADEVLRIPIIDYVLVFALAGVIWLLLRRKDRTASPES